MRFSKLESDASSGSSSKSGSKPSTPESGSSGKGGSSPSKPKSPVSAPPKAPKAPKTPKTPTLPKLPKPKPGWKPPKGSLPGSKPGHPPYHGSGGHLPVAGGGHGYDHHRTSLARSCTHPKGMDRLRCEKADAVLGTLFAIIGLLLVPFLIYLCIRYRKKKKSPGRNRHEEEGVELTRRGMNCDPEPQTGRNGSDSARNIGLADIKSQESSTITKEQTQDRSFGYSPRRKPSPTYKPSTTRSVSRGRKRFRRHEHSMRSITSSLSPGMIRIAVLGQSLQDPTVIDVPPSLGSSKKAPERRCSSGDVGGPSNGNPRRDEEGHRSVHEGRVCVDDEMKHSEEAKERSRSSKRSRSHVSEQQNEEESRPDNTCSRCSNTCSRCSNRR